MQLLAILISVLFWKQLILPGLFLASMSISGAGLGRLRPREDERVVEKGAASSSSSSYRLWGDIILYQNMWIRLPAGLMKCLSLFDACAPWWVLAQVQSPSVELTIRNQWNWYWLVFTCVCCLFALGMTVLWTRLVNLPILGSTSQGLITSSSSLKVMWIFRLFLMKVSSLGMPIIDIRLFWAVLNSVRLSSSFSVSGRPSNPPSASVPVGSVSVKTHYLNI